MKPRSVVFGLHAVSAALRHDPEEVQELLALRERRDRRLQEVVEAAAGLGVPVRLVSRAELARCCGDEHHQGVAVRVRASARRSEADLDAILDAAAGPPLVLVLDQVQDPHNLGACLRSADAAGAAAVVVPAHRAAGLGATVRKVACGAAESVPLVTVTNLARTLRGLQDRGLWIAGAAGDARRSIYDLDLSGPAGIVLGAEGKGLRRVTREACDFLAAIPMAGQVESLNVSVAAGVILYEAVRQRRQRPV